MYIRFLYIQLHEVRQFNPGPYICTMKIDLHFRRSHDRLVMSCPVVFAGMPSVGEGLAVNISPHGCTVEGMRSVLNGSYMKLGLFLPDSTRSLRVELAAVRWVTGSCFGVEFLRLPVEDRKRLDRFLGNFRILKGDTFQVILGLDG